MRRSAHTIQRDESRWIESLSLFDEPPADGPSNALAHSEGPAALRSPPRSPDRHLVAARRLSRAIGRIPSHSPEQVRTGRLICRHLLAMLDSPRRDT